MDSIKNVPISTFQLLSLVGAFLLIRYLIGSFAKKRNARKIADRQQALSKESSLRGMNVTSNVTPVSYFGNQGGSGTTNFSGTDNDIPWTLNSSKIDGSAVYDSASITSWIRSSQWRTSSVNMPPGKFIVMMSTPGHDNSKHPIKRGGMMNDLINLAAEKFLDLYVGGYFGSSYASLVNVGDDGVKIDIPELRKFFILTNHEPLARKFLSPDTVKLLATWVLSKPQFARESQVEHFGVLFSPDGMILSCQADMANANEAKVFSDFGVAIATKMKAVY